MPDLEELLRADGAAWRVAVDARRPGDAHEHLADAVDRGVRRRWRPITAAVAVTVIVCAAVAYLGLRGDTSPRPATSAPVVSPPVGGGEIADPMFTVPGPDISGALGPAPIQQPNCTPGQVDATAELRQSAYGIVGVVELHGQDCSIPMDSAPSALTDATGDRLDIPLAPQDELNGANMRPDLSFASGNAAWGFGIDGSWCGPAPAAVVIPLGGNAHATPSLTVPLTGPTPDCSGTSDATLVRGVPGRIGESVLPAPAAWSSLTATLHVPATPPYLENLSVTLTNSSDTDVRLSPCPRFSFAVDRDLESGNSSTVGGPGGLLPCDASTVVPAHGQLDLPLTVHGFDDPGEGPATKTTIRFAIAGGAAATVTRPAS